MIRSKPSLEFSFDLNPGPIFSSNEGPYSGKCGSISEEEKNGDNESGEEENQLEPVEQLVLLTSYLRDFHFYCIWCGCKFNDEKDLLDNCPGKTRDDH